MIKLIRAVAVLALFSTAALAQPAGQLQSGDVWGNSTAARAPAQDSTITALIDRAISGTQGAVLTRNGSAWVGLAPGTVGLPLLSGGAAANLAYGRLTYSGFQTVAASSLVGNPTGSLATAQSITLGSALAFSGTTLQTGAGTGDISWSANSFVTTLATVNSNVGSFGSSTSIPTLTVNGKGLITAISGNAVIAPAGTLTGNTLAAGVLASSLTSTGTLTGGATGAGFTVALGTSTVTGTLGYANGGCNAITQVGCRNNAFPTPTRAGDIAYWNGSIWTTLAGNNSGTQVLQEDSSGTPLWATVAGTGTLTSLTPGSGLVSSVAASCSQTAITTSGTISKAECLNAQSGSSYAIGDGDRAKLITTSNAGAQAYTIAQAGASSAFQAGWFTDVSNISTSPLGLVTITPTTSTIDGAATLVLGTGQSARIVSDGTNYKTVQKSGVRVVKTQVFTGTGTYTPSTGMLYAVIECIGGGGGGGSASGSAGGSAGGGGGGGGSYSRAYTTAATVGASKAVTIGSGAGPGSNGGDTSVGSICIGKGGTQATGGTPGVSAGAGGAGGVAGTGDFTATGNAGGTGFASSIITVINSSGAGGAGPLGGSPSGVSGTTAIAGGNGTNYGAGGGGGMSYNNVGGAGAGGSGTNGVVIITEYTTQ